MSTGKGEITNQLLQQIGNSIETTGVQGTIDILKQSQKRIDFVMKMVSQEFKTSIDEFVDERTREQPQKHCLMFSAFYLHKVTRLSYSNVGKIIKRDKSKIIKFIREAQCEYRKKEKSALKKYFDKFDTQVLNI